jgi:hypothetical protein
VVVEGGWLTEEEPDGVVTRGVALVGSSGVKVMVPAEDIKGVLATTLFLIDDTFTASNPQSTPSASFLCCPSASPSPGLIGEPLALPYPQIGTPISRACSSITGPWPLAADRSDLASEPPRARGEWGFPYFHCHGPKGHRSWALSWVGFQRLLQTSPKRTVDFYNFCSDYSKFNSNLV